MNSLLRRTPSFALAFCLFVLVIIFAVVAVKNPM